MTTTDKDESWTMDIVDDEMDDNGHDGWRGGRHWQKWLGLQLHSTSSRGLRHIEPRIHHDVSFIHFPLFLPYWLLFTGYLHDDDENTTKRVQVKPQGLETRRALAIGEFFVFSSLFYCTNYFLQVIYVATTKIQQNECRLIHRGSRRVEPRL